MKKIVFVIEQLYGGGAERVTAALMNELCADAQIHLISTYDHDEAKDYPIHPEITRHVFREKCGSRVETLIKRVAYLRKTISEIAPMCVVSLAGCGANALLTAALVGKKIPLILSERNDPARFPASRGLRALRMVSYMQCKGLVFQTAGAQAFFPPRIRRKSVVISNPITAALPSPYEGIREKRIVNCCRLVPQKNLDLLIEAFEDIAEEFPDMSLEIYGEGPLREQLEKKVLEAGLKDRVRMPGYTDQVFLSIRKASMFALSSDYEGISNAMLEALAIGVPVVCTDCPAGGAREVICHGENGLLVPVGDRKAMADAMRTVLRNPELAECMGRNGSRLREELSASRIAAKWNEYIEQVCMK